MKDIVYRCLQDVVADQAQATPDRVALCYGEESLTYGQLVVCARAFAAELIALGLRPGEVVAVAVERSFEMVVGLLAVLEAGGVYMMLDPSYPHERAAYLLADSGARLVLTSDLHSATMAAHALPSFNVNRAFSPREFTRPVRSADDAAYITYTSGSTGRPKATLIPHRAVPGYFTGVAYADFTAEQVHLQHSSLSWDVLTLELWSALLTGARCVLYPERVLTPADLSRLIDRHGISILFLTAPLFHALVDEAPEVLARVSQIMTGADVVSVDHIRRALVALPNTRLTNCYGPSECTVYATAYPIRAPLPEGLKALSIGRPIGDRRVYLLDRRLRRTPVGVVGEIYIGGPAVALGYLNRPGLTAATFVADPFAKEPGSRMYRTGDRARYRPDGTLDFLGRGDDQVKVRGFRIEVGEIEATVRQHPGVLHAVVVALGQPGSVRRLVGYIVPRDKPGPDAEELRRYLGERLPEYMVPPRWVTLERLPLTANNKVDRAALPVPLAEETPAGAAPRSVTELALAEIWGELLGLPAIGVSDNFFELGGHSLLAMQALARIRTRFEVELSLRAIFDAPTLEQLAARIDASRGIRALPPLRRLADDEPRPLSTGQRRMWYLNYHQPDFPYYNIFFGTEITGPLDVDNVRQTWADLHQRHGSLRCGFPAVDGHPSLVVSDAPPPWEERDLSHLEPEAAQVALNQWALETATLALNVEQAPLYRVRLARLGPDRHAMLVVLHHLLVDGWSLVVLAGEAMILYAARQAGLENPLPPVALQSWDYAAWNNRLWDEGHLRPQRDYWLRVFETMPSPLLLPADRPRPTEPTYRGSHYAFSIPLPLCERLNGFCREEGITRFVALLSGFCALLHQLAGSEELCIGVPAAGRTRPELQELVSLCMNVLPLRVRVESGIAVRELFQRVRSTTLSAFENEDLPQGRLQDELGQGYEVMEDALYQAMFGVIPWSEVKLDLGEMAGRPVAVDMPLAGLDVTLEIFDQETALYGRLEYKTDLFDRATIERWCQHYVTLLEAIVSRPEARVGESPTGGG